MIKFISIFLILSSFVFAVDDMSMPTDYTTVSSGTRANLAANFTETQTKFNSAVDSLEQVRARFSNYTGSFTVSSLSNLVNILDSDNSETAIFLVRSGAGDSLFYVKEDSTFKFFGAVTYDNLTASRLTATNANKALVSVSDLTSWFAGTTNQISVADDGDGTITLSTPQDIGTGSAVTFATVNTGQGANELYGMDQNVTSSSAVTFATVNTGNGANELYAMNQDVETTDAVTFSTVNTGNGANELYAMDQNVQTTDDPTFDSLQLTDLYVADKIGIGDDTPDYDISIDKTKINGTSGIDIRNRASSGNSSARLFMQAEPSSTGDVKVRMAINTAQTWALGIDNSDSDKFKIATSDELSSGTALTINTSGNVGIGTSSPNKSLDVQGGTGIGIIEDVGLSWHDASGQNSGNIYTSSSDFMYFRNTASNTTRMTIDNTGKVGIGTASPTTLLDLTGSVSAPGEAFEIDPNLTLTSGTTAALVSINTSAAGSITTEDNTVTYSRVGALDINEPIITKGATDAITTAYTLRVGSAPTEGTNNWSLYVANGTSQFALGDEGLPTLDASTIASFDNSGTVSNNALISVLSGTSGVSEINLGDSGDEDAGAIYHDNLSGIMGFDVGGGTELVTINSSGDLNATGDVTAQGSMSTDSIATGTGDYVTFTRGSFKGAVVGCSDLDSATVYYEVTGYQVTITPLNHSVSCTSNATNWTIDNVPSVIAGTDTPEMVTVIADNGTRAFGVVEVYLSGTVAIYPNAGLGSWTASGSKAWHGPVSYTKRAQ